MSVAEILTVSGQAVVLAAAILGYLGTRRSVRRVSRDVGHVHELVDGRSDRQEARIEQLTESLTGARVDVPVPPGGAEADEKIG
jgi:hypothetical protein